VTARSEELAPEPTKQGRFVQQRNTSNAQDPGSRPGLSRASGSSYLTCQTLTERNTLRNSLVKTGPYFFSSKTWWESFEELIHSL